MMVLVSYDISLDNKNGARRLRKVAKICQNYGQRVQYSVFEISIDPTLWIKVRAQLIETIDEQKDSLRFYFLGANWKRRIEHIGAKESRDPDGPLIL
ncbi:MAG: CRISPR-associated endonuclease Cas2 [Calditrichaeota bacterium]|nr:MAG: CRISPR-associated endonuclease Cas2 [Calditrichota bacterium]